MSKIFKLFASAAVGLWLVLSATVASAVNPIINGNFKQLVPPGDNYSKIVGWTVTPYVHPKGTLYAPTPGQTLFTSDVYDVTPRPDLPITHHGRFDCAYNCPKGGTSSVSQMITGLEQNKTYTISFYIQGWAWVDTFISRTYPPIPPFVVSLGSQSQTILLPAIDGNTTSTPWFKKSVTFTYTDPGSSALLTFTQNFSGELHWRADQPLPLTAIIWDTYDWVFLSLIGDGIVEEVPPGPKLSVQKALNGNRINDNDQFTVQILNGSTVVNSTTNSTTSGTVTGGTTGATTLTAGTSYTINEVMASGSASKLGQYSGTLSCTNTQSGGTSIPVTPGTAFTVQASDAISCTLANKPQPVTLQMAHIILPAPPKSLTKPLGISYTGNNGWSTQNLSIPTLGLQLSTPTQTLSAANTPTTITAAIADTTTFSVQYIRCQDLSAALTGNTGTFAIFTPPGTVTIPAATMKPGAAFRCLTGIGFK